jgi:hypothetical protein
MEIEDYGEILAQGAVYDIVKHLHAIAICAGAEAIEDLRIDTDADVIEAHLLDTVNVVELGVGAESLRGVVGRLREPLAGVNAMAEMLSTMDGRGILRDGRESESEKD